MSPEKQRIAIAEACGWRCIEVPSDPVGVPPEHQGEVTRWTPRVDVPDYLSDLNACAAMEATLTAEEKCDYVRHLCSIMDGWSMMPDFTTTFATAPQRCEAFLRVKEITQ